jgi:hypothetical protein
MLKIFLCASFGVYLYHQSRGEVIAVKKIYKGTVEGSVIHLERKSDLPAGTHALVTLKTVDEDRQEDIQNRQLKLLDKGFNLGNKLSEKREDLYAR